MEDESLLTSDSSDDIAEQPLSPNTQKQVDKRVKRTKVRKDLLAFSEELDVKFKSLDKTSSPLPLPPKNPSKTPTKLTDQSLPGTSDTPNTKTEPETEEVYTQTFKQSPNMTNTPTKQNIQVNPNVEENAQDNHNIDDRPDRPERSYDMKLKNALDQIPLYSGEFEDFVHFSAACQSAFKSLPPNLRNSLISGIHKKLTGPARGQYILKLPTYVDINAMLTDMGKAFDPISDITTWAEHMKAITQKPGETVSSYGGKCVCLLDSALLASDTDDLDAAERAKFVTDLKKYSLKYFFAGLYPPIRSRIEWERPKNLMEALNLALRVERNDFDGLAYKKDSYGEPRPKSYENKVFKNIAIIDNPQQKFQYRNQNNQNRNFNKNTNTHQNNSYNVKPNFNKQTNFTDKPKFNSNYNNTRNTNNGNMYKNKQTSFQTPRNNYNNFSKNQSNFDIRNLICFRCNQKGHFAKTCRVNIQNNNYQSNRNNTGRSYQNNYRQNQGNWPNTNRNGQYRNNNRANVRRIVNNDNNAEVLESKNESKARPQQRESSETRSEKQWQWVSQQYNQE